MFAHSFVIYVGWSKIKCTISYMLGFCSKGYPIHQSVSKMAPSSSAIDSPEHSSKGSLVQASKKRTRRGKRKRKAGDHHRKKTAQEMSGKLSTYIRRAKRGELGSATATQATNARRKRQKQRKKLEAEEKV